MPKSKPCFILCKVIVSILLYSCIPVLLYAQQIKPASASQKGLPFITSYRYQDYNSDGVNWWAAEDDKGVMYFANESGILIYDGSQWELITPPGIKETRSLVKGKDGRIYVGTTGDIGYLAPAKNGKLQFVSLKPQLPEKDRTFREVWQTSSFNGEIYFGTGNKYFIWDYNKFRVLESKDGFHQGAAVNGQFYSRIWNRGLCVLKNDSFHLVPGGEKFASERTYAMLSYDKDHMLIGTRTQGLFLYDGKTFTPFKTEADPYIFNTSLYGGLVLSNGLIALNTFNDGLIIIDRQGKLIQHLDKSVGLLDNSVDYIFEDSRGMLWMPLFNGIAKMDLHSSFSYFDESTGLPAKTVFSVDVNNDTVYAGTNNGVYFLNRATRHFQLVQGTGGQIYSFAKNGNDYLVAGAEFGLQKLSGGKAYTVIPSINYNFHAAGIVRSKIDTTVLYVSTRTGLAAVRYTPGNTSGNYTTESFQKDLNARAGAFEETKEGYLWIYGDNPGEIKLVKPARTAGKVSLTDATVIMYNYKQGLPLKSGALFTYGDTQYFASEKDSIFTFNEKQNHFVQDTSSFLKKYIVNDVDATSFFPKDNMGRIWGNLGTGVFVKIPQKDGSIKIIDAPFRELKKNYPVWNIATSANDTGAAVAWFASREGIINYDGNLEESTKTSFNTIIRSIKLNEDSVYFSGFNLTGGKPEFSNKWNSVRIQYAAPFFKQESETVFSTYLEGRDKNWTDWKKQDFREFGNLSAGTYTFHVKGRNIYDVESAESVVSFTILPPWYGTWWAFLLYACIALAAIYFLVRWRTRQLHEKHRELEKTVADRTVQLSQRVEELAVINSVQEGLVREMDMEGIYELVGEKIREIFNAQVIDIVTYDRSANLVEDKYAYEKGDRTLLKPRRPKGFRKHVIDTRELLMVNENVEKVSREYDNELLIGEMPKSMVYVPMIVGEEVKGIISLQNMDKEHAFTEADVNLLTTLANSMSVALESARLFDETNRLLKETEQRTAELSVINSVQDGLSKELDIQGIYALVGEKMREVFNAQVIDIVTYDKITNQIEDRYTYEKGDRTLLGPRPLKGFRKYVIETGKQLVINSEMEKKMLDLDNVVMIGEPSKSVVFVPMIASGEVTGVISVQNIDEENAFSDSDVRLLTTLGNSMSVALESARLFDETKRLLGEAKQRAAELGTVNNISKALASQLDADGLIKLVGDQLKDLFNANIVYLALLNQKTNIIHFPYQVGDTLVPMKLGEGLTSKIILNGEPLLINKDLQELRAQMGIQKIGVPAASYLGVPIPVGDENIGVLSVQSTEQENRFNENDLRLLSTIASSVGVALRNATLFEEVKLAKQEAEQASKLAEKANEAKSAFLSTVSHELRTPLTSVLGFAKIIKKRLEERIFPIIDKSDSKIDKTVNQISENLHVVISEGERLTHLINDVLDLAKIEAGKMEWQQENVSLPEVAERAIAATTSLFDQKSLSLIREIDDDLPEITGDKDKLIQVVINLISNSVKFTDTGAITCRVKKLKDEIIVSISDTGIGIDKDDYGAVFEQFKQVGGDTLTDKPKGTGLGLPICKEIVEHLGGRIWLESEKGKGSTFSFALPINKTTASRPVHLEDLVRQLKEQVAYSQLNIAGQQAAKILIVDDDDSIRSLLQQELGDAGYSVDQASNGKEALARVRANRPDLIILDIMMPEMNGFDTAAVLKNDPETMDIPIIVLSVVQDKARGFRIGIDRYLTKPIDTGLLFNEIGSLLEQGKSKKKVMIVDEDSGAVSTLTDVLKNKGYEVMESNENELHEKAVANLPDIIIISSVLSGKQEIVKTLRFEKGLENVLFVVYQ